MRGDNRGQVLTIEALVATFILFIVLAVVVEATSVTPLTTSFTNQHVKYELQNMGQDILASLDGAPVAGTNLDKAPSRLEQSVSTWLQGSYTLYQAGDTPPTKGDWYTYDGVQFFKSATTSAYHEAQTPLEQALTFAFSPNGIAYNVEVRYPDVDANGNVAVYSAKMIWNGDPSDNCVTVSRYVALHDVDATDPANTVNLPTGSFLISDFSPTTSLHNVVEVRLTLWVM